MRIIVNKHWRVYLDFGPQVVSVCSYIEPTMDNCICIVNSHALPTVPVHKKNRIASLLCIFETTILVVFNG